MQGHVGVPTYWLHILVGVIFSPYSAAFNTALKTMQTVSLWM